jgi:hypothetical protein
MQRSFFVILIVFMTLFLAGYAFGDDGKIPSHQDFQKPPAAVDVAILLDTSNSMDGLISQAKSQLWTIIQQFAKTEKYGQVPKLRVALFEYGNTNLPVSEGYLRQVVPLGDDLDVLSEALFGLTTNGGDEYCGMVIDEAITRLDWSTDPGSYQVIFIAGNEPFTQGPVDFRHACQRALGMDIVVNTIHCGSHNEGVDGLWQQGALLAKGEYFNIDQDRVVHHIRCPQDQDLIRFNKLMNETYLWYGSQEKRDFFCSNQKVQDSNAVSMSPSVAAGRTVTKSSKVYDNRERDLVDAMVAGVEISEDIPEEELPEVLQEMSPEERTEYIQSMVEKRAQLKKQIGELAAEREAYLAVERKRLDEESGAVTLGDAVVVAIQKQLAEAGFATDGE